MLVQRRLLPAVQANLAHSLPNPADTTDFDFPFQTAKRKRIEIESIEGNALVVTFTDQRILDEQNVQIIGEQLFSVIENLGVLSLVQDETSKNILKRTLVLDLENVDYISSAFLGKLITLNKIFDIRRTREDAIVIANGLGERERLNKTLWPATASPTNNEQGYRHDPPMGSGSGRGNLY